MMSGFYHMYILYSKFRPLSFCVEISNFRMKFVDNYQINQALIGCPLQYFLFLDHNQFGQKAH